MVTEKIQKSINVFLRNDMYLLKNNGHERTIAHRLAVYLEKEFPYYHVDCEYNLNVDTESQRKCIYVLETELKKFKPDRNMSNFPISEYEDYRIVSVYPDIIVHHRGTNLDNLLVIEIKKSNSTVPDEYDLLKLIRYTSQYFEDGLKYKYGAFIKFFIGDKNNLCKFDLFMNGQRIQSV